MYKLPISLIYLRLLLGPLLTLLSFLQVTYYSTIAIIILSVGLLSDIFDGIIARRLNISTQKFRRLDSTTDLIFFSFVGIATLTACPSFFQTNIVKLLILFGFEAFTYVICYLKFKKEIATHTISSKIWTLVLFSTLIQVIATCTSNILFELCFYIGILTRLEIIAIVMILKVWSNDVPTFYHAVLLRNGKMIKRHKLFNG
ncbi:MAG: CDP-alcohol phosphatidyltransferase family protein [Sphingobacteriaceae bacterium]|nr:MAG: CDP-alcohol phosphatidyltransferase family protein [Sphingobacteriaceae bacterium]